MPEDVTDSKVVFIGRKITLSDFFDRLRKKLRVCGVFSFVWLYIIFIYDILSRLKDGIK